MAKAPVASVKTMDETQKAALYEKIGEWVAAKAKAAEWTAKEMELRKELFAEYFPDAQEGTNNLNLEWGKQLKANCVISRNIVKDELAALRTVEAQKLADDANYKSNIMPLIDLVVEYEPKLVVGEYKKLSAESQLLLADMITIKDGAPSLSLETPKT